MLKTELTHTIKCLTKISNLHFNREWLFSFKLIVRVRCPCWKP